VLDVRVPGQSGLRLQETLKQAVREMSIIFLTGRGCVLLSPLERPPERALAEPAVGRHKQVVFQNAKPTLSNLHGPSRRSLALNCAIT